jgi:two-component system response regulator FixJ
MNETVHVVDDHAAVRRSLAALLGAAGHAVALHASGEALLAEAERGLGGGCVILDVRMPGMDGLEVLAALRARPAPPPVVLVTGHADIPLAVRGMRAGAFDFVEKPYTEARILGAVEEALAAARAAGAAREHAASARRRLALLSPREAEVLALLVEGHPNKTVAARLGISPRTVEVHRAKLMEKLEVRSLPEAVRLHLLAGQSPSG